MDTFGSNRTLSIMKALLPYIPPSSRRLISILLFMEQIQETMRMIQEINSMPSVPPKKPEGSILDILKKNCSPKEREMFEMYENMIQAFQLFQEFQTSGDSETSETADSSFSNLADAPPKGSHPPLNPSDLLHSMLTPEQENLFSLFQNHAGEENHTSKEDESLNL